MDAIDAFSYVGKLYRGVHRDTKVQFIVREMAADVTVPISNLELSIIYDKLYLKIFGDRAQLIANPFDAFAPWNPSVDDIEFTSVGKTSEQGIKFRLPSHGATFFFAHRAVSSRRRLLCGRKPTK